MGDPGSGLGAAGEGDGFDVRMLDQALPDLGAGAVDDVQNPRRKPRFPADFREVKSRHRRQLRGLGDDGVSCRQRGRDFPGKKIKRKVPGRDAADHAERHAERVIQRLLPGMGFGKEMLDGGAEELEIGRGSRDVDLARRAQRLSDIDRFGAGERVGLGFDEIRDSAQLFRSFF